MKWKDLKEQIDSHVSDDEDVKVLTYKQMKRYTITLRIFKKQWKWEFPNHTVLSWIYGQETKETTK